MGLVTSRRKSNVSLNGCARRRWRTAGALTALSTDYTDLRSGREPLLNGGRYGEHRPRKVSDSHRV